MLVIIWSVNAARQRGRGGGRGTFSSEHSFNGRGGKNMQFKCNSADILRTFYARGLPGAQLNY